MLLNHKVRSHSNWTNKSHWEALFAIFVKDWKDHVVSNVLYRIHTVAGWENFPCTSKADHTWSFHKPLILKAGQDAYWPIICFMSESFHLTRNLLFVKGSLIQFVR